MKGEITYIPGEVAAEVKRLMIANKCNRSDAMRIMKQNHLVGSELSQIARGMGFNYKGKRKRKK